MKIAIQGHPTRGKEVIQTLESLGGINKKMFTGIYDESFYFIDYKNEINDDYKENFLPTYKLYTLEKFEKEFPFKIEDIVLLKGTNMTYKIIALKWVINKLCYKLNNGFHYNPKALTTHKEMKEERNITLTLDKAKEWYKKGGELKEIALQAYSEEELTKIELPKSWEEFCKQGNPIASWRYNIPTKYEALHKLELLRDCYRGLFVTVIGMPVWCIKRWKGELIIKQRVWGTNETFLSFQSLKVAEEYLKNFEPLIKQAKDLI